MKVKFIVEVNDLKMMGIIESIRRLGSLRKTGCHTSVISGQVKPTRPIYAFAEQECLKFSHLSQREIQQVQAHLVSPQALAKELPRSSDFVLFQDKATDQPEPLRVYLTEDFVPLHGSQGHEDAIGWINKRYYSIAGGSIYKDMSTNDQLPFFAEADAKELVKVLSQAGNLGRADIFEWGGGNGTAAATIIATIEGLRPKGLPSPSYHLVDVSSKMLEDAKRNPALSHFLNRVNFTCRPGELATDFGNLPFALIRFNEFYSDLPYQEILYLNGRYYEAWYRFYLEEDATATSKDGQFYQGKALTKVLQDEPENLGATFTKSPTHQIGLEIKYLPIADFGNYPFANLVEEFASRDPQSPQIIPLSYGAILHFAQSLDLLRSTTARTSYLRFHDCLLCHDNMPKESLASVAMRWNTANPLGKITVCVNAWLLRKIAEMHGFSFQLEDTEDYFFAQTGERFLDRNIFGFHFDPIRLKQYSRERRQDPNNSKWFWFNLANILGEAFPFLSRTKKGWLTEIQGLRLAEEIDIEGEKLTASEIVEGLFKHVHGGEQTVLVHL